MKLPPAAPPDTQFHNAPGSIVEKPFALAARQNPDNIQHMAENKAEEAALKHEALARQYVIIVDRSGSMAARDGRGTRWDSAANAVARLVETIFRYDVDHSVPIYLFDNEVTFLGECNDAAQILQVFREYGPRGTTDLAKALNEAMEMYAGQKRPNFAVVPGTTFIVILDGATDNDAAVKQVLYKFADPRHGYIENDTQIAVSFLQVGDDPHASRFLADLDDNMGQFDIVDTKKDDILYMQGGIDKLLHDAIFD